jgi:TolB-like protein
VTDGPHEGQGITSWERLRRRKVVQWSIAYAAGAWGFLQVVEYLGGTYDWPRQIQQLITLALLIGLPIVVVLAWYHGDRGQQRITTPEVAILTLLLLGGGGAFWYYERTTARDGEAVPAAQYTTGPSGSLAVADARPSVAVLPFVDLSQARDQEYLGDGLAEEILNQLAQVPALRLVGRTSSFSFKGRQEDLRTIGRKLGVAHLLEGSVRKDGNELRVTAQLVRADDGTQLWSKKYARELRDVFAVQDDIARDVAQALSVKLDAVPLNRALGGTTHIDAYDRYLRYRQLLLSDNWGAEHHRQRVQLAREAVAFDPGFVLAWDELATSLDDLAAAVDGTQAEQLRAEALRIRASIAQMAPGHWSVQRERAYDLWRTGMRAEAVAVARKIKETGPLTLEHAYPYMSLIFAAGHLEETVALGEQLRAIEPLAMFLSRDMQFNYLAARRYDDAAAEYRRSLALEGSHHGPAWVAFLRTLAQRNHDVATLRALHRQLLQDSGEPPPPFVRDFGAVLHDRNAMLAILRKATADPAYRGGDRFLSTATGLADALGDADLAATALRGYMESRQGFQAGQMTYGSYWTLWLAPFSGLRGHPEFKKLLIETGLADYWRQAGRWADGCKPVGTDDFQCR